MRIAFGGEGVLDRFLGCWGRFKGFLSLLGVLETLGCFGEFWGVGGALSGVWGVLKV